MEKAVVIQQTRRALTGGLSTSRVLWAICTDWTEVSRQFKSAKEFARTAGNIAWSVEVVDPKPDVPPSRW